MKTYRIFAGSIQQETNSWSPARSTLSDFDRAYGQETLSRLSLGPLLRPDVTLIAGTYAHDVPSGPMRREVFDALLAELLESIPDGLDGVFLYLHGALEVEGVGSGDAAIARAVRRKVGDSVRIAVAMDFHANVSPALVESVDIACAYRTAPHIDMEETQERACRHLMALLESGRRPSACLIHLPMLFTGDCVITKNEPARSLLFAMTEMEREAIEICVCFGQPWVDTPWVGPSVTVWAQTPDKACELAQKAARMWWDARCQFHFLTETCLPEEAFPLAAASACRPVFLSDSGDNTTAGAAGDRAGMLRRALSLPGLRTLIAGLTDRAAVDKCWQAGEGARLRLRAGGSLDHTHGDVCSFEATVLSLGGMLGWYGENAGRRALVRAGSVDVLLTERRCAVTSPEIIKSGGADPFAYDAVVVKLGYLYPDLAVIAPRAVFVMTEGASTARVETIRYTHAPQATYPADPQAVFSGEMAFLKK